MSYKCLCVCLVFYGCSATVKFSIHNGNNRSMHVLNSFDFYFSISLICLILVSRLNK